jgi:uncharacterized protein
VAQNTDVIDLGRFALSAGEGRRLDLSVRLDDIALAGQRYAAGPAQVPVRVDVDRMTGGWYLRLRYSLELAGPCMRCLEDAEHAVRIDVREIDQPQGGDEELSSPYMEGDELDLRAWARDSLVLELPTQIVCSDDCRGICPICGENLNTAEPGHEHEKAPDARWEKLSDLRFE